MFSVREKQETETSLFFIVLYFLLIFDIKTIYNIYIYIEKFIANLVLSVSKNQRKLFSSSLLS
ncbi:hypothetical protein FC693_09015 [Bacillus cereus]|nr:hypothetical protein FC693_09015 [Bacillus cereus]